LIDIINHPLRLTVSDENNFHIKTIAKVGYSDMKDENIQRQATTN